MTDKKNGVCLLGVYKSNSIDLDLSSLRGVRELHKMRGLDDVFFDSRYNFPCIRQFANVNRINVHQVDSLQHFRKKILDGNFDGKSIAYVSGSDSPETLTEESRALSLEYHFETEVRIIND